MRTIKKTINTATTEGKSWKEELCKLLRNYRTTPPSSTGKAPATAMFNRTMRTKLPKLPSDVPDQAGIEECDNEAKRKMKVYADSKANVKPQNISVGDTVIVKRDPSYVKSATPYDPKPYVVKERKGTMVTAAREYKEIIRYSSQFKQIEENEAALHDTKDKQSEGPASRPASESEKVLTRRYPKRNSRHPPDYLKMT